MQTTVLYHLTTAINIIDLKIKTWQFLNFGHAWIYKKNEGEKPNILCSIVEVSTFDVQVMSILTFR